MYILSLTFLSTKVLSHSKSASQGKPVTAAVSKNAIKKVFSSYLEINSNKEVQKHMI
jgi:hypothetical protein